MRKKKYKFTAKHRKKLSEARKGRVVSEETRKRISKTKKGRPVPEEVRRKISQTLIGRKNPEHSKRMTGRKTSEETKRKMSETHRRIGTGKWNKGRKLSEETKKRISQSMKGVNLGKEFSKEHKKKLSEMRKNFLKNPHNHPNWQGGLTTYKRKLYLNGRRRVRKLNAVGSHGEEEWEFLKKQLDYQCLACGQYEPKIILTEDHIIPLAKEGTDDIGNIQPLCRSCNAKKHTKIIKYQLELQ